MALGRVDDIRLLKEVRIKIESVIENLGAGGLAEGDAERTENTTDGFMTVEDAGFLISYAEVSEGGEIRTDVTYDGRCATVARQGAIRSSFIFEEGVSHSSLYEIAPYSFDAQITTRRIRSTLTDAGGELHLYYNMKIGGAEKSAKMKIWISTI